MSDTKKKHSDNDAQNAALDFLVGGGEMAKLIREKDWSKTPIDAIAGWSQALQTTVSIAFVVEQAGGIVRTAASAAETIAMLMQSQCDVLLSDIGIPDMDGYRLMQQVRGLPPEQNGQVKAISLTADAGDLNQQQALQVGSQQHIAKPVELEALAKAITILLRRKP
jgi:CheY-like chemotaxis protein